MAQIYLGLAIHNHQPIGNFSWIFEQAYQQAYVPMIEALEKHSGVRLSLHYSGCLWDWLQQHHPEFLPRVANLVQRGQVEIMAGAYYEPVLPAIPDADKLGQIKKMREAIVHEFGCKATGLWLAERVWEPHLPKSLAEAGIEWTVVDDTHFKLVGLEDKDLFGYYVTEEQGCLLKVFPTSKYLRYSIPWRRVEEVISFLREEAAEEGTKIAVMGDDGEKFGIWPGTYKHCWQEGWVESFFSALEENSGWLHTIPLGQFASAFPPLGRIYLPCASYDEMLEWALPADKSREYTNLKHCLEAEGREDVLQFLRGGFWRYFLAKYPESNRLHKKMLRVHQKVYKACSLGSPEDAGLQELWQGQCNCPYWHGVFGGLYLADIRAANYHHLLQAEAKAEKVIHPVQPWLEWQKQDFDCDGSDELLIEGNAFSLYISPTKGGTIFEWDLQPQSHNLLSTLSRRPEAYHQALKEAPQQGSPESVRTIHDGIRIKEPQVIKRLNYDWHERSSLIDHFIASETTLEDFSRCAYEEMGDFVLQPYDWSIEEHTGGLCLLLHRRGFVHRLGERLPLEVKKTILLSQGKKELTINYQITNKSHSIISGLFGSEWNINLLGGGHNPQAYYRVPRAKLNDSHLDSWGELSEIKEISLGNTYLGIELTLKISHPVKLWRFPVETVSNSEDGLELVYQASCIVPLLPLQLLPEESLAFSLNWSAK